ncbi:hypothetical protein BD413DRAFT_135764 [Trametes elegans]|nr:hypothetical protein BD413DRAFT_135764 [Trametes elegans]
MLRHLLFPVTTRPIGRRPGPLRARCFRLGLAAHGTYDIELDSLPMLGLETPDSSQVSRLLAAVPLYLHTEPQLDVPAFQSAPGADTANAGVVPWLRLTEASLRQFWITARSSAPTAGVSRSTHGGPYSLFTPRAPPTSNGASSATTPQVARAITCIYFPPCSFKSSCSTLNRGTNSSTLFSLNRSSKSWRYIYK